MKGLLLKDLYNLQGTLKIYLALPVIVTFLSYTNQDMTLLQLMVSFLGIFIMLSSFAYDEMCKFDSYALTLPLSRRDLVKSKFALMNISTLYGIFMSLVLGFGMYLLFPGNFPTFDSGDYLLSTIAIGCAILILNSIMAPFVFQYGTNKARIIVVIIFMVIGVGGGVIFNSAFFTEFINMEFLEKMLEQLPYLLLALCIISEMISYIVSCNIVLKKEY